MLIAKLEMAKAVSRMVVNHADRLHKGIADGWSNEIEAPFFQIFTHRDGLLCLAG